MLRTNRTGSFGILCAALLAVLVLFSAPLAEAQRVVRTIGGGSGTDDDQLRVVDPVMGQTISSVTVTLAGFTVTRGLGLTVQPGTGTLFAILRVTADPNPAIGPFTRRLVTINPATGVATDEGLLDDAYADIAFATDGTLFAVSGDGATTAETLFTLDFSGAGVVATNVATLGNGIDGEAIGIDPNTGLIYHLSGRFNVNVDQILETIDPANAFTVANVPLNDTTANPGEEYGGMAFWGAGLFLVHNIDGELNVISTTGDVRFMSTLDHVPGGLAITGTAPDCTAAGNICGAANNGPDGPSVFYSIAQATGVASMVGPVGFERVSAMAFTPDGSALFATGEPMDGSNVNTLVTIDPATGAATAVAPTGSGLQQFDFSFRRSDGTLYTSLSANQLGTVDTGTAAVTVLGATGVGGCCGNGIAFDFDDTLFHVPDLNLSTLDQTNGAATTVAALSFSAPLDNSPRVNAADFNPAGTLFGVATDGTAGGAGPVDSTLVTINKTTGVVTNVGATQLGIDAIAIAPATADLSVTKVDDVVTVAAVNDVVTYTITVTNNGPGVASVVQVTDVLSGAAVTSAAATTSTVGTCDDSAFPTITCDLGAMAPAAVATITIAVNATTAGAIVNDVDVTTGTPDPNAANNSAQVTTGVGSADVSITKVDTVDPVAHPAVITYNVTVTNNAAQAAGGVVVTDTFTGAAVTFGSATPSQGTCNAALPIVCNLGDIPVTGVATITVTVNTAGAGTVTDTAVATTATTDPTPANNTAVETTLVNAIDLVVTKTDSPDPIAVGGGNITYVVTVSNTGNIAATTVALTDNFTGAAATFVSATPSQGTCTPAFPAVPCALGTINAGANATVTIVVTPTAGGTVTNTVSATAAEPEPTPANNTNIVQSTTVAATQDFSISVSPSSITILPGQSVTFTITITPLPFVASVSVDCTHSIPLASCSGPITINPGNVVTNGTITLTTTGFFVAQNRAPNTVAPVYALWLPVSGFGVLGLVLVNSRRRNLSEKRRALFVALLSLIILASLIAGCAFGRDRESEGTPGGSYTVTFTGTGGSTSHSTSATVNVQGSN